MDGLEDLRGEPYSAIAIFQPDWWIEKLLITVLWSRGSFMQRPEKLDNVELGRGIAALAVVIFHANASMAYIGAPTISVLQIGEHGVDFFFVLSGFIISYVHADDIGVPRRAKEYTIKRLARIFPILWVVVGLACLSKIIISSEDLPARQILESVFLYPSLNDAVPLVLWTLRHELLFYSAFIAMILHRGFGTGLFCAWFFCCIFQLILIYNGTPLIGLPSFFVSSFQLDFALGAIVAYIFAHTAPRPSMLPLAIAIPVLALLLWIEERNGISRAAVTDYVSFASTYWTLVLGLAFSGVLYGLLRLEGLVKVHRLWLLLGAASYSIYLVHTLINPVIQRAVSRLPYWAQMSAGHLLLVAGGICAGIALHLLVERPISRRFRLILSGRSAAQSHVEPHMGLGSLPEREASRTG